MELRLTGVTLASILLVGCISGACKPETQELSDPLESFNRIMFSLNYDYLDPYFLRPLAIAWRHYLPVKARSSIVGFTSNLEEPASMVNSLLKGDIYDGFIHFNRFFLNTLIGIGGFIDVASMANTKLAKQEHHGFGSTLGYYGIPYYLYIVLPGYGSFTLRQNGGNCLDSMYPTLSWLTLWMYLAKWFIEGIETRARLLDSDFLLKNSSDPYIIARDAYFQYNDFVAIGNRLIERNNPNDYAIKNSLKDIDSE
ncbi:phospholipid-binding lipoprotein MlaA [Candidatus Profftia tarda]|nr:phospholipid-binding lipoprotein MlaA [Candidatus Profftia tarda]